MDANGKKQSWETVVQIPFIEEDELFAAMSAIDHKEQLLPAERIRNSAGKVWSYRPPGKQTLLDASNAREYNLMSITSINTAAYRENHRDKRSVAA